MGKKQTTIIDLLDEVRNQNLFVHNDQLDGVSFSLVDFKKRPVYLVETLSTLNAIVHNGTMLLYGGHGGGKTTLTKLLGQLFLNKTEDEIEQAILRGHPQLTEEKILGSLNFKQILSPDLIPDDGNIEVKWNEFVNSEWKIIDEINRLSPYAQNILLSLLAEGVVKYHNQSKQVGHFTVYATMNPKDEGNFNLPLPFLDRFALALPITMPDYSSLQTIGKVDRSQKNMDVHALEVGFIEKVRDEVHEIPYSHDAEEFINILISEFKLCDRIVKEASSTLNVDNGLCTNGEECRFLTDDLVCNKIINPVSVRVKEDLFRYGKALAWYLGDNKVTLNHIKTLAPYMIWHRSQLSKKYKNENIKYNIQNNIFSINIELEGIKNIINTIHNRYKSRKEEFLNDYNKAVSSELTPEDLDELIIKCESVQDDLILKKEIHPDLVKLKKVYSEVIEYKHKIKSTSNIIELNQIKNKLKREYSIGIRQQLSNSIERKIAKSKSEKFPKIKLKVNWTVKSEMEAPLITKMLTKLYGNELKFKIAKNTRLSSTQDSYNLEVMPLSETILKLVYQGPEDEQIYKELNAIKN